MNTRKLNEIARNTLKGITFQDCLINDTYLTWM